MLKYSKEDSKSPAGYVWKKMRFGVRRRKMMDDVKILIADDEQEILDVLGMILREDGYEVAEAHNGREAVEMASEDTDLYILDVNMPEISGFSAGMEIRKKYFAPIIFLTAYSGESDKALGFAAGADDYIVKPFSGTELLLRVKSLLRRSRQYSSAGESAEKNTAVSENDSDKSTKESNKISYKDIIVDIDEQTVCRGNETIVLTYTEFRILQLLLSHRKKIYSLENIYKSVWEDNAVGDETIMVHIKNLRKKLGDDSRNPRYIKTAWGKGYYVD